MSLPEPLRRFVAALPTQPPSFVLARALDRVLMPHLGADVRELLQRRTVELLVSDLGVCARVTLTPTGFRVAPAGSAAVVRISAPLDTYWRLARGTDDADRLFFERALLMEGDTEVGLVIKTRSMRSARCGGRTGLDAHAVERVQMMLYKYTVCMQHLPLHLT